MERLPGQLAERAERGIALTVDYVAPRTGELLERSDSVDDLTSEQLQNIFTNDLTAADTSAATPPPLKGVNLVGVYAVEASGDDVAFFFFAGSRTNGSSGFVARSVARYACGILRGEVGSPAVVLWDADCPPAVAALAEHETEIVSMVDVARRFDAEVRLGE